MDSLLYFYSIMFEASIISFVRKRVNLWPMTAKNCFPFRAICTNLFPWLDSLIVLLNQICSDPWILPSPCSFPTPPSLPQEAINKDFSVCLFFAKTVMPKSPCKNFWVLCSVGGLSYFFCSPKASSQQLRLINCSLTHKTSKYIFRKRIFIIVQRKFRT